MGIPYDVLDLHDALEELSGLEVLLLYCRYANRFTLEKTAELLISLEAPGYSYPEDGPPPPLEAFPSLTRERARQLEVKALRRMRRRLIKYQGDQIIPHLDWEGRPA